MRSKGKSDRSWCYCRAPKREANKRRTGEVLFDLGVRTYVKGLSTREAGRGHATPHMPVETAKCWWLLKIEPNAWAGGKGSCAVCVDLQAVGALEFFGELYSLAKGFWPIFEWVWAGFREKEGSIFSNHQHFAVSTGICGVACPLPASRVDKPLVRIILLSVTLGKDRHLHTVTLGKDRHIHIRIYACATLYWQC